jgi:hypothetical protein
MKNPARRTSKANSSKTVKNPDGTLFLGSKVIGELRILARLASPKPEIQIPERRAA